MSKFFKSLLLLLSAGFFTATGWATEAVNPKPVYLLDAGSETATDTTDVWVNLDAQTAAGQLQPSTESYSVVFAVTKASSAGNFYATNVTADENTKDFSEGDYVDLDGNSHTTIFEEMKSSLGLSGSINSSIYKDGLGNGGFNGHTATVSNLDSEKVYVMYYVAGGKHSQGAERVLTNFKLGTYEGSPTVSYVVTGAGTGTTVATHYQTLSDPTTQISAAANAYIVVRVSDVQPTAEGTITFSFPGGYSGINAFAIAEIDPLEDVSAEVAESVNFSNVEWSPSNARPNANVTLDVSGEATLTMDKNFMVNALTVQGVGPLTIATTGSNKLTATTTAINVDTTVEAGAASLGAVTLEDEKTITVADTTTVTSLTTTRGVLATSADMTITRDTGFFSGLKVLKVVGGTLTSDVTDSNGNNLTYGRDVIVTGASSNLVINKGDGTGWNSGNNSITLTEGGTLTYNYRDTLKSPFKMSGGTVEFAANCANNSNNSGRALDVFNSNAGVNDFTVTALEGATVENPTVSYITALAEESDTSGNRKILLRDGDMIVDVAEKAKLHVVAELISVMGNASGTRGKLVKNGTGVLELAGLENIHETGTDINGGVLILSNRATLGSGTTTIAENAQLVIKQGANKLSNAITNNGTITADTATVDLTGATLSGSGTYAVTNGATLILKKAQVDAGTVTVAADATLKVKVDSYDAVTLDTVELAEGKNVVFVLPSGEEVTGTGVTMPAQTRYTYTATAGEENLWSETAKWTQGGSAVDAVPSGTVETPVEVVLTGATTLTMNVAGVTLSALSVSGGDLTIAGENALTVKTVATANKVVVSGALILDAPGTEAAPTEMTNVFEVTDGGTLTTKGYLNLPALNQLHAGTLTVSGGKTQWKNEGGGWSAGLTGTVTVGSNAILALSGSDIVNWSSGDSAPLTINVKGELDVGTTRLGLNKKTLNVYGGATVKGEGDGAGAFDFFDGESTINVFAGDDAAEPAIWAAKTRLRNSGGSPKFSFKDNLILEATSVFSDAGGLKVDGTGTLKLTGANTYTGGTEIATDATIEVATIGKLSTSGAIVVNGRLRVNSGASGTNDSTQACGTAESPRLTGSGVLEFVGTNYYVLPDGFTTPLAIENNHTGGIVVSNTNGMTIGTLSGNGKFRSDWGTDDTTSEPRVITVKQSAASNFSGMISPHKTSGSRRIKFLVTKAEGVAEGVDTTLTLEGNAAANNGAILAVAEGAMVKVAGEGSWAQSVVGAGTIIFEGKLPTGSGYTDAENWTGTLALVSTPTQADIAFNSLGNASSTVRLQDYTGSLSNKTAATCYTPNLEIKGTNTINAATEYAIPIFQGDVSGDGTIVFSADKNTNYLFSGDFSAFTGTMELTHTSPKIAIGAASNTDWNAWNPIVNSGQGNITIATAATLNGTFRAVNGVETTSSAILSGNGTIDSALTLIADATIDASATLLTVTGAVTLPDALTVKIAAAPTDVTPVSILTTTTTPNVANTTVRVIVNDETLEGNFELVKNGDKLQVRVAPERIAASETPAPVTEVPSAIFLDTATFSGYGQTFTVLQYTGEGTPDWSTMDIEGLPAGVTEDDFVIDEENKTWGFVIKKLSDELIWLPVGDSITEGEQWMGHADSGDENTRGGYRYQVWKQLDERSQSARTVGFRTGHSGTTEDPATTPWAWHAGLYGGDITPGNSSAQLFNVETTLEVAGYPDVISVLIGINDLSRPNGGDSDEARAKVYGAWAALVDRYAKLRPNTKVLAATLLPVNPINATANDFGPFNEMVRAAAAAKTTPFDNPNVVLVDVCAEAFNNTFDVSYFKDQVHPNETGSIKVAEVFRNAIYTQVIKPMSAATPAIVHVDNATNGLITVLFNKKIASTTATELTITGTNLAGEEVSITCTTPTIENRVMTFALPAETNLVAGTYTVTVNGSVTSADGVASMETVTASGATVEIFGTGAAANVPASFREGFIHRNTLNVEENPFYNGVAPTMDVIDAREISSIEKVGYYVELQRAGQAPQFVWVSMDASAFNNNEARAGIPTTAVGTIKSKVSDLAVYGNRGNFAKSITDGQGVIEFSPHNITATDESIDGWPAELQDNAYGWNDTFGSNSFGSMQVARIRTERDSSKSNKYDPEAEMLFAFNGFNYNAANNTDIGIGSFSVHRNNAGGQISSRYDWTNLYAETQYAKFATNAYTVRKIELWVMPAPTTTTAIINVGTGDGQYTTWLAAKTGLNLADEMESLTVNFTAADQTFTFDETVTIDAVTVQGEAGGKLAKSETAVTVTTADLDVTTSVKMEDDAMALTGDVNVATDCVLTYNVGDGMTVNATHTGNGSIAVTNAGVFNGGMLEITKTCSVNVAVNASASLVVNVEPAFNGDNFTKALADNVTVSGAGAVVLQQGIAYANFDVAGVDVVGTYYLGIGGTAQNPIGSFTPDALYVGEDAALKVRAYRDYSLTVNAVYVEGVIEKDGGNVTPTMTVTADGGVTSYSGEGQINLTLILEEGVLLEGATGLTVQNLQLPNTLKIAESALPSAETPVVLFKTTAFADAQGQVEGVTLMINDQATEDYLLYKTAEALELRYAPWTTVTEVTASGDVDSWSELLAAMTANRQNFDTSDGKTPSLIIDFGDKGEGEAVPGTFTFDLEDATALSLTKVTIQGTNGGTIQKSGTANVTATATAVNTNVEIAANAMLLGETTLANGCTLTVNDSNALGEAANFSAGEGSTVKLVNVDKSNLNLGKLTNADGTSNLILNNVKAYIYDCKINTLTLEGNFQMNNGTTNKSYTQCVTVNALAGAGTFIGHQSSEVYVAMNVKSWEGFTGAIDLSHEKSNGMIFFFGEAPERFTTSITLGNVGANDGDFTDEDYGTLYVTAGKTLATTAGTTWHLRKLVVEENASFQIKGWATIATSCSGAVSVESGATLDLRALNDLSGINATVKAGGRILVKSGATVPDTIVFESEDAILGICPASVDDIGSATLTVTASGTAKSTATKKGYKTDGVTELGNWTDKGAQDNTLSFGYDPIFDGELCWWAYEFDADENTTTDSTDGPDNTGRDKTSLAFDGSGSTGRILVGQEYVTNGDGTKALRLAAAPHRGVDPSYPTAFTATVYGKLTSEPKTILLGFGSTYDSKDTIALVTGASPNEVSLVWVKGHEGDNGDYPENCVTTLATTTVPNGTTENHLFGFSYELKDTDEDGTNDTTEIIFYVDGDKYQPYKVNKVLTIGDGFQAGSLHGGWPRNGKAPTESDWLYRMGNNDADKAATIEFLRVYDEVLPEATFTAMANAYPYISKVGRATRTIAGTTNDTTWHEAGEWSQVKVVDGVAQDPVDQDNPDYGTTAEPEVGTQVFLNVDGENTLYLNEFYSTTTDAETGETDTIGNSKLYYERLEINGVAGGAEDSLTMWAGRLNPAVAEENKNSQSAVLTVLGYTKINTNVTFAHNVAYLSGPVAVAEGKYLHFDFSGFDVMKVPSMPVTYRLTGFLDEETRSRVTSTAPAEPVNARSIDLGYKTDVNQYTFKVDRYPVTAFFTEDEMAGGNSTEVNFNNLNYVWQGNDLGKTMNWEAEAVDPQGNHIIENTLAKFVSLDSETQQEKIVTVTLATNDTEPITLTLAESALSKETEPAVVEPMLGAEQLIVGNNVIVDYTGTAATLARTLNEASAETTGVIRTAGFTVDTVDGWRANLSVTGDALAGVGTISGKVTFEAGATLDASAATAEACLSAKDADLTNLKDITVNYDAAAGTTLKVLSLPEGHTAKSLIGCTVTAVDGEGNTVATWTETGDGATLVVVRADGLYVTGRPVVKAGETEVTNNDLTLPLARRAAELSATSVSLTGVVNMAGDPVDAPVADAAEVFTNVAFDMNETVVDGVVTAKLKYDFGVSDIAVVTINDTQYVVAKLIVSNHSDLDQNTAAYANGTTIDVSVKVGNAAQAVTVEPAADMTGAAVAPAAELPASTRYVRFQMPTGNGTFEIKARASK